MSSRARVPPARWHRFPPATVRTAVDLLKGPLKLKPNDNQTMYAHALVLYRQGRFAASEAKAIAALQEHRASARLRFLLAMACQRQMKNDDARCWLSQAEDRWQEYEVDRRDQKPIELTWWADWHQLGWLRAEATQLVNAAPK